MRACRSFVACLATLCAFLGTLSASSAFAQRSYDLFTSISGASNASLEETAPGGVCRFDANSKKKLAELKYADQRYAAVYASLEGRDAERLVNEKNKLGQTPLHFAIYSGDGPNLVDALLSSGADPNAPLFGKAPIWHALTLDDENATLIGRTLLDYGADPNATTKDGESLLHCAAAHNNFWVAQRLLESGADLNATYRGKKAIELTSDGNLKELLGNWGKKPYPYSAKKGETPLHKAAAQNNYWAVKRLLDQGADQNALFQGKTPRELTTDAQVRAALGEKKSSSKKMTVNFSKKRVSHIFIGDYDDSNRHSAGGHSYGAFLYMKRANMKPKTHALYENGVQVCSVERRSSRRTADDPANPSHTFFPSYWTKGDILAAVNSIALEFADQKNAKVEESERLEENVDGVQIVVILRPGANGGCDVITGYPIFSRQPLSNGKMERLDHAKDTVGTSAGKSAGSNARGASRSSNGSSKR